MKPAKAKATASKTSKVSKAPAVTKAKPEPQEFVLRRGDGNKVFTCFDPAKDRFLFEFGGEQDTLTDKPIADGVSFTNHDRTATWHIRAIDGDTLITVDADTARLVGVTPDQLSGWNFKGG